MQSPQDDVVSVPTPNPNPDVLVNNVGTLYTFCPLTLGAKKWIDDHVGTMPNASGTHLSWNIVIHGD